MSRKSRFIASALIWVAGCCVLALAQEAPPALSLAQAVALALAHHSSLQAARQQVESARANVDKARAGFLPKLDVREQFTRSDNPTFAFSTKLNQGNLAQDDFQLGRLTSPKALDNFYSSFAVVQPLFNGGRTVAGFAQARLAHHASESSLERQTQEVLFRTARAYYGVLLAREQVRVAQSGVKAAEANTRLAHDRFASGLVVESDFLSAQVRLSELTEQALTAVQQVSLAEAALNDSMGLPLEEDWTISDQFVQRSHAQTDLATLETQALASRPDHQSLAFEEQAGEQGVSLARAAFLPTLNATASYDINNRYFTSGGQDSWFVGAVFQWHLFDGGGDAAQVTAAQAEVKRIQALRARQASAIRLEVREAFLQLKTAEERIGVARAAITQAETALRIVTNRYQAGLTTIVNLLGAETALTQGQERLAQALYEYNVGLASVELAVGSLRQSSFVATP